MLTKLSQVQRDINFPRVWRYEYNYQDTPVFLIADTTSPGTLISANYSRVVTVTEPSIVRVIAHSECYYGSGTAGSVLATMELWSGAAGAFTNNLTMAQGSMTNATNTTDTLAIVSTSTQAVGALTYQLVFYASITNRISVWTLAWEIDVCRV